jgi:hypothetical protein
MKNYVEFRSDAFPPYDNEDQEVKPGRHGKRLAEFLVRGLREKGFAALEPTPEGYLWVIRIKNQGFRLWIGCGNYDENAEDGFLCFIEPCDPIRRFGFLWRIDTGPRIQALREAMDQVLSANPAVRDMKWRSHRRVSSPLRMLWTL